MFGILSLYLYYQFHQISHHHHYQFHQISCLHYIVFMFLFIINPIKLHIVIIYLSSILSNFTSSLLSLPSYFTSSSSFPLHFMFPLHYLHVFIINPIKFHILIMSLSSIPSNFTSSSSSIPSNFILSSCLHH